MSTVLWCHGSPFHFPTWRQRDLWTQGSALRTSQAWSSYNPPTADKISQFLMGSISSIAMACRLIRLANWGRRSCCTRKRKSARIRHLNVYSLTMTQIISWVIPHQNRYYLQIQMSAYNLQTQLVKIVMVTLFIICCKECIKDCDCVTGSIPTSVVRTTGVGYIG